jgi:hypothetical protein
MKISQSNLNHAIKKFEEILGVKVQVDKDDDGQVIIYTDLYPSTKEGKYQIGLERNSTHPD